MQDPELTGAVGTQNQKLFPRLMQGLYNLFVKVEQKCHTASLPVDPTTIPPHFPSPTLLLPSPLDCQVHCSQAVSEAIASTWGKDAVTEPPLRLTLVPCLILIMLFAGNLLTFKNMKHPIANPTNRSLLNLIQNTGCVLLHWVVESSRNLFLCARAKDGT